MDSLQFSNPNPATGQSGTLVTTTWFQNVNDEISNVITKTGGTLDSTNHSQLYTAISTTYAPLLSPTFTGVPLVPDTNSTSDGRAIVNFESMKAYVAAGSLGYTPVHQGGGTDQLNNTIYIGWSGSDLLCTVDATDLGAFAFKDYVSANYLNLTGGNVTGTFTYNGTTVATKNDVNAAQTDTENWVTANYVSDTTWNNNINQDVRTTASPTFQAVTVKSIGFDAGGTSSIYQDTNTGDVVIATNNGSYHYNVFNADGSVQMNGDVTCGEVISNGDIRVGGNNWLYTNTIGSYGGTVNVDATLQQSGQDIATQSWVSSNYVSDSTYSSDFGSSGNIINLAYGHRINTFTVTITSGTRVNYPQAFSANATSINMNSTQRLDLWVETQDSAGFTVLSNTGTSQTIFVCAIGPK